MLEIHSWQIDAHEKIFSAGELSRAPSGGELYRGDRRTARCFESTKSTRIVERETTTLKFCSLVVDEWSCTARLCCGAMRRYREFECV